MYPKFSIFVPIFHEFILSDLLQVSFLIYSNLTNFNKDQLKQEVYKEREMTQS